MPARWSWIVLLCALLLSACQAAPEIAPSVPSIHASSAQPTGTASFTPETTSAPTAIPTRAAPTTYVAQPGDTLASIAADFGLRPQTVLWANYELLFDNPDFLTEGMSLQILPADGLLHQVGGIDTLSSIASFFAVAPEAIIAWPANQLEPENPTIFAGQWLFIPGGLRQSRWRQMPDVPRDLADLDAAEFGLGACRSAFPAGPIGDGEYAWPVQSRTIGAEAFSAWHPGVDIVTSSGEEVLAADDGVMVFSGWSNLGYGNLAMIDHGNGDYTLYSGLSSLLAPCGLAVFQGEPIALAAITGHPAGPILHFEIRQSGAPVDPLAVLP